MAKTNETVGRIQHLLAVSKSQEQDRFARAPLPYPREFDFEIDRFVEAVRVVVSGDFKQAKEMVEAIDHEPMVNWYDEIAQHVGAVRLAMFGGQPGKRRSGGKRNLGPTRIRRIAARDGFLCGYCDIRLVEPDVLRDIDTMLGGGVLHKRLTSRNNRSYHGIWLMTAITLDHVEPFAKHHNDSDDNLVASCWSCNFGKYHYELQELGLKPPRMKRGASSNWQGLRELVMTTQ